MEIKNSERDRKQMLCGYCANIQSESNQKCAKCEYNPDFKDNFDLGIPAQKMVAEGVLYSYGGVSVVSRLNSDRFNRIKGIFDNTFTVADSPVTDDHSVSGGGNLHTKA